MLFNGRLTLGQSGGDADQRRFQLLSLLPLRPLSFDPERGENRKDD